MIAPASWPVAFLGAIVSAGRFGCNAIVGKLGVPRRTADNHRRASSTMPRRLWPKRSLPSLRERFSLRSAALQFVMVAAGGIIVWHCCRSRVHLPLKRLNNSSAETTLSLITFLPPTCRGAPGRSGVISTVTAGLYWTQDLETSAQTRIEAEAS
jgi:hypothetical protein